MKKLSIVFALVAASLFTAKAQETFTPGVYLQLQGGAAYDLGEASFTKLISPSVQGAIGYRFNEVFGARIAVTGWQGKNYSAVSESLYKYKFVQPNLDLQFDLASLFNGWRSDRIFTPYWFLGGGAAVGLDNQDAIDLSKAGDRFSLLWEPTKVFWAARTGLGADIRLTEHLAFNLEVNANMYPDTFNSKQALNKAAGPDFRFNALAGFTIRFGKKAHKAPAVVPVTRPVQRYEPVEEPKKEIRKEEPADEKDYGPAIYQGADVDIFFDLNKSVIRDSEINTLNRLVSYLRNNPGARVKLDGYADRGTGTAEINQELSEQRVAAVRQYLISRGIASSRISVDAHGDTVQPFSGEKNRAVTCRIR